MSLSVFVSKPQMPGVQSPAVCSFPITLPLWETSYAKPSSIIIIVRPRKKHCASSCCKKTNKKKRAAFFKVWFSLSTVSASRCRVTDTSVSSVPPAFVVVRITPSSFKA